MEQRISLVTIGVSNMIRARDFYVEGLGWKPVFQNEDVVFFQLNAILAGLYSLEDLAEEAGVPQENLGTGGMALAYNTRTREEVDTILERAVEAGASRTGPAVERSWGGYSGYFSDPDGHLWEVAWNPAFQLGEKGDVMFG